MSFIIRSDPQFGTPFSGDIHQSFEDYLASNGVGFDSLFEEPSDLRSERRDSPSSREAPVDPFEASYPPQRPSYREPVPLPPVTDYRRTRPQRPQTFLYGDERPSYADERPSYVDEPLSYIDEPLSYGDLTERRRPYSGSEEPKQPAKRPVVIRRPTERARRPVVELLPAPAIARQDPLPASSDYAAPYAEQENRELLPAFDFDQPQVSSEHRPGGDVLEINFPLYVSPVDILVTCV